MAVTERTTFALHVETNFTQYVHAPCVVDSSVRVLVCALVGLFFGTVLGFLFVPNPTGPFGAVLAVVLAVLVGGGLYRTGWLRGDG